MRSGCKCFKYIILYVALWQNMDGTEPQGLISVTARKKTKQLKGKGNLVSEQRIRKIHSKMAIPFFLFTTNLSISLLIFGLYLTTRMACPEQRTAVMICWISYPSQANPVLPAKSTCHQCFGLWQGLSHLLILSISLTWPTCPFCTQKSSGYIQIFSSAFSHLETAFIVLEHVV